MSIEAMKQARVPAHSLPALRDKEGHLVKYPGRIAYVHDNWRLVYIGTLDGRHEFYAEEATRIKLGPISFAAAKAAMLDLIRYNEEHPL
jgi:hypothetical protein